MGKSWALDRDGNPVLPAAGRDRCPNCMRPNLGLLSGCYHCVAKAVAGGTAEDDGSLELLKLKDPGN